MDGTSSHSDSLSRKMYFVVDGLQRLQSFCIGLCGTYNGKSLYYDLFSDCDKSDYDFKFADSESRLPNTNKERYILFGKCLWYSASLLFEQLTGIEDTRRLARNIAAEKSITNPEEQRQIEDTVRDFHDRIFSDKSIGLSTVVAHLHEDMSEDRLRIAEMFRRLNDGGTRLPTGTM